MPREPDGYRDLRMPPSLSTDGRRVDTSDPPRPPTGSHVPEPPPRLFAALDTSAPTTGRRTGRSAARSHPCRPATTASHPESRATTTTHHLRCGRLAARIS